MIVEDFSARLKKAMSDKQMKQVDLCNKTGQDILGYEEIPASMLKSGNNYFALKIDDDSMYPDYKTGDIIIIKQQNDCNSGDDCIVMVNGDDATFKRVIKQEKSIILKPLNNNYEPYYFNEYEILTKPVKIIGIAIEVRRKLR